MARAITPLTSIVLDAARFGLALLVAAGHWTQPQFQEGWPDLTRAGVAAVGGFFVLSGFTIRLLTPRDEVFSPSGFAVERLSRLWSVALPALLVTVLLDAAAYAVNRDYYVQHWGAQASLPLARVALNAIFASQLWGHDVELFSNSLFWSLSYEAGFYFLYWVHRSSRGPGRYLLVLGGCVLVGPNIVLLLVPWLSGVLLYDASERILPKGPRARGALVLGGALGALALALAAFSFRHAVSQFAIETTRAVQDVFWRTGALAGPLPVVRFDAARIEGELIVGAAGAWWLLLCALCAVRGLDGTLKVAPFAVKLGRRLGDFTFPLYLFHFPMFVLAGALGIHERRSSWQKALLFVALLACIYAFVPFTTSLKWRLRRTLARARSAPRAAPDA